MFKLYTLAAIFFGFSVGAAQAAPTTCLEGIAQAKDWQLSPQQLECLSQNEEIKASLAGLCSQDQKDFSAEYSKYRSYEIALQEAFQIFSTTSDASVKFQKQVEMRKIKRDWMVFGYQREMDSHLHIIWLAKSKCEGQ